MRPTFILNVGNATAPSAKTRGSVCHLQCSWVTDIFCREVTCSWRERPQISLAEFYRLAKKQDLGREPDFDMSHSPFPPERLGAQPRANQTSFSSLLKHHMLFRCWCCHFNFSLGSGSHAWGHLLVLTLPSGGS